MRPGTIISAVFLLGFGLFWCGLVGLFDYMIGGQIAGQVASTHYTATAGQVTQSDYTFRGGSKGGTYRANIRYRYKAAGHAWSATRYRYSTEASSDSASSANGDWVRQLIANHPVGSAMTVYYNPKNPQDTVLSPGVDGSDLMLVLFLTPFNLVGLGLIAGGCGFVLRLFRSQVAGGVKIIKDGFRLRVRLPVFTPIMIAMVVTGALAFVCIFPLGFAYKFRPPTGLAAGVIALAYGAGIVAFAMQWRKIAAGEDDLVIDDGLQTLHLPKTFGRKETRALAFSDISTVTVEVIVTQNSKGGASYSYAPTLNLRRGETAGEKLAQWGDRARADAFAQWLREQLHVGT
jgi:hypothetical protein